MLTDNQKAASFLGWSLCPNQSWSYDAAEPDCSDPRNYMKALEGLENRGFDYQINFRSHSEPADVAISHYVQIGHGYWYDGGIKDILGDGDGATVAEGIVKALAALYDAERVGTKE